MVSLKLWYLFLVQFVGGFFWGGFNLLQLNFVMEAVSPEKRIRCLSYLNVMNALALLLGSAAGGALIHRLPPFFGYSFLTLFLISCLVRLLVVFFMSAKVREVRLANV
jgi:MFS family permease